jgi:hypothetical protein
MHAIMMSVIQSRLKRGTAAVVVWVHTYWVASDSFASSPVRYPPNCCSGRFAPWFATLCPVEPGAQKMMERRQRTVVRLGAGGTSPSPIAAAHPPAHVSAGMPRVDMTLTQQSRGKKHQCYPPVHGLHLFVQGCPERQLRTIPT